MKRIFLIITFIISSTSFGVNALEYKGLEKLSKKNSFMDDKGKPYSINKITDKKNSFLIIYNHGSIQDVRVDPCKKRPQFGVFFYLIIVEKFINIIYKNSRQ